MRRCLILSNGHVHNLWAAVPLLAPAAAIRLALHAIKPASPPVCRSASGPGSTRSFAKVRVVWTEDDAAANDDVRRKRYLGKVSS
jgi:hypothetical protein